MEYYTIDILRVLIHLYSLFSHYLICFFLDSNELQNLSNLTLTKLIQLLHSNNLSITSLSSGFVYGCLLNKLASKNLSFKQFCKRYYFKRFEAIVPITYIYYFSTWLFAKFVGQIDVVNIINKNWLVNLLFVSNLINEDEMVNNFLKIISQNLMLQIFSTLWTTNNLVYFIILSPFLIKILEK